MYRKIRCDGYYSTFWENFSRTKQGLIWRRERARSSVASFSGVRAARPSSIPGIATLVSHRGMPLNNISLRLDRFQASASHVWCHNRIVTCPSPLKSEDFGDLKKDAVFRSECSYKFVCTRVVWVACVCWLDVRVYEHPDERHKKKE